MQLKWVQAPHAVVTVGKEHQIPRQSEQFELAIDAVLMSRHSNAPSVGAQLSAYSRDSLLELDIQIVLRTMDGVWGWMEMAGCRLAVDQGGYALRFEPLLCEN